MVAAGPRVEMAELQERGWFGKRNMCLLSYLRIRNSAKKDKKNKKMGRIFYRVFGIDCT